VRSHPKNFLIFARVAKGKEQSKTGGGRGQKPSPGKGKRGKIQKGMLAQKFFVRQPAQHPIGNYQQLIVAKKRTLREKKTRVQSREEKGRVMEARIFMQAKISRVSTSRKR